MARIHGSFTGRWFFEWPPSLTIVDEVREESG